MILFSFTWKMIDSDLLFKILMGFQEKKFLNKILIDLKTVTNKFWFFG